MLPLVTVPSIQLIIDEFVRAGILDILVISSRRKKALEDYLDREVELEEVFTREGKRAQLERIEPTRANSRVRAPAADDGDGARLLAARAWVGSDPCVVAYPDDLHMGETPLAAQLAAAWRETGCSVLASITEPGDVSRYGVLAIAKDGRRVDAIVEKPAPGAEPSHEVSIGRFLYTPEFFEFLEEGWKIHLEEADRAGRAPGEYFHIYALNKLMAAGRWFTAQSPARGSTRASPLDTSRRSFATPTRSRSCERLSIASREADLRKQKGATKLAQAPVAA
jgi:UTP--glucose-1-phosphate uridylyltransferase